MSDRLRILIVDDDRAIEKWETVEALRESGERL
jgi:hypothetical protein